jgi:Bacterial SH3 domain
MKLRHWIVLLAAGLFVTDAWADEAGTAIKADELKAAPFRDAKVVGRLASGDKLDILKQQGGWYQVKSAKGSGWVHMLSVRRGEARKGGEVAGLAALAAGRAGTGKVVATTGVRGLNEEDLKAAKFDEAQIKKMEANTVSKDAARTFAAQAALKSVKLDYLPKPEGGAQ